MTFQVNKEKGFELRKSYLDNARRVVVKVGSAVLTGAEGLDNAVLENPGPWRPAKKDWGCPWAGSLA